LDSHSHRADEAGARPVIVFGAAGQLGEVMTIASQRQWRTLPLTRADVDLTDGLHVRRIIAEARPWAIINCAGYNNVDGAEDDAERALAANGFAVRTLAAEARAHGAVLVQYSSDFIFDGDTEQPYLEDSQPNPQSVYAASKMIGEWFAADAPAHYIVRVESLFGGVSRRKSSLDLIIARLAGGERVRVFTDRVVSPSYVWDVADATTRLLQAQPQFGVYHCVNNGHATWFDIATEVARQLNIAAALEPTTLADARLRAPRPRYCALSNAKLRAAGISLPSWQDAVARELEARTSTPQP
jgi:dTDP-4-dehydrorhamnose reductase